MELSQHIDKNGPKVSHIEIPHRYICPISQQIFFEPVMAQDGRTYEREVIEQYFSECLRNKQTITSPLTRASISNTLIVNWEKVSEVHEFLTKYPQFWQEVYISRKLRTDINVCIKNQDLQQFMKLIDLDPRILSEKDASDETLFDKICHNGTFDLLKLITSKLGYKLKGVIKNEILLLVEIADCFGIPGITLLAPIFQWNLDDYEQQAILFVKKGNLSAFKALLPLGVSLDLQDGGDSLLHIAAEAGNINIIEYLIAQKMDINLTNFYQETALHIAARMGREKIVEYLLQQGANVKAINHNNLTAAKVARDKGHLALADFIERKHHESKWTPLLKPLQSQQQNLISKVKQLKQDNFLLTQKIEQLAQQQHLLEQKNQVIETLKTKLIEQEQRFFSLEKKQTLIEEENRNLKSHLNNILQNGKKYHEYIHSLITNSNIFKKQPCAFKERQILKGHSESISEIAVLSTDLIVSSSYENFKIWNLKTGQCILNQKYYCNDQHHRDKILPLENSNFITTLNYDLALWNSTTGQLVRKFSGHRNYVYAVALLPNGHIISGGYEKTLKIWNIETGQCLKTIDIGEGTINTLYALSEQMVLVHADHCLFVIDITKDHNPIIKTQQFKSINCIVTLKDNRVAIAGNDDLSIWDFITGEISIVFSNLAFTKHQLRISSIAVLDNNHLLVGCVNGSLEIWDIAARKCIDTLNGHHGAVTCIAKLHDESIISGSKDKTLRIWKDNEFQSENKIEAASLIPPECKMM